VNELAVRTVYYHLLSEIKAMFEFTNASGVIFKETQIPLTRKEDYIRVNSKYQYVRKVMLCFSMETSKTCSKTKQN